MKKIHFSHANGFPANSYEYFFSHLDDVNIDFINTMGHAGYENKKNLSFLRDELIDHISHHNDQAVVGMGHSSGAAATLFAAAKRPELFEQIILIDPITLGIRKRLAIEFSRKVGLWNRYSPAKKARNRRFQFKDRQEAFEYYQQKPLFKHFHASSYQSYIEHGLTQTAEQFELTFSPLVEADIFSHVPTLIPKDLSKVKATIIYAKNSNIFGQSDINWWKKNHPHFELICFDGYHLFPFELPEQAAQEVNRLLIRPSA
jgi:pimeloyl-ACP methyl ester carboxylesterase